jgi:hypothetical protein
MAHSDIIIDGRDLERDCEAFMRFRLTYEGQLLSSKPFKDDERDRRAAHKHSIRRVFHSQLKEFWRTNRFLNSHKMDRASAPLLPANAQVDDQKRPMADVLGDTYGHHGYRYVPLVRQEISLACSLRILCLRRDTEDAVLPDALNPKDESFVRLVISVEIRPHNNVTLFNLGFA